MTDQPATADLQQGSRFQTVTLATPIVRGETTIATLNLRKPRAGELRGLSMQDVLTSDASALLKLIPRISDPPLTQNEADDLEVNDFSEIAGAIRGFFMTKAENAMLEAMMTDQQLKS